MTGLFQAGEFTLASGRASQWKIEADALGAGDWAALAAMAVELFGQPGDVEGVPRGGLPFAEALKPYRRSNYGRLWIVDDVATSGVSIEVQRADRDAFRVVAFARPGCPSWVNAIFTMGAR